MDRKLRIFSWCLALAAALLTGCGGGSDPPPDVRLAASGVSAARSAASSGIDGAAGVDSVLTASATGQKASLQRDFNIFDHDGPGIGRNRDCSCDHIECTVTRECSFDTIECTSARSCDLPRQHDSRDCSACLLRNPFGGCILRGNDPVCEAAKAAQNAIYDADHAARKADCERIKSTEKLACEANKSALKLDCERLKSTEKLACEADKSAKKLDCERIKVLQSAAGELWEAAIHEAKAQALAASAQAIPAAIRAALAPYFEADLLDSVRWTAERGNILSWSKFSFENFDPLAITYDNVIVFRYEASARYDVGLWAHELEHVKQYRLLGIDGFAEYYADYWIDDHAKPALFATQGSPTPAQVDAFVAGERNKLEALATVQSHYVCSMIDPSRSYRRHWDDQQTVDRLVPGTCRPR